MHKVTIPHSYSVGKHQVTNREWDDIMGKATNPSPKGFDADNQPVVEVSWFMALAFLNKKSAREARTPVYYSDKEYTKVYSLEDAENKAEAY